ncbi:enoyl-CoA hydratase/isomerase family protein [Endozoicomonas sp. OPT23]|uniref:enoyl-CoA hydratase/isomerase family protein n=1 Tax=Endozoicomonas sp. OPT23 TaxID=2072845 RepID=UPI00129B8E8A|nr:enoyl-CoA hydratase/isomerase family protein [Endozoicomonas sp. OPT23]MRI34823.1 enoyl-CoA hydratase/isomerase family protein [Endozoicomonas sp. OPT23]
MTDKVLCEELKTVSNHSIGVLTLNAEKSLNSLDQEMIDCLLDQLTEWQTDSRISCIFIQGAGDKAFCAGGDVRSLRQAALSQDEATVKCFFEAEYQLDYLLHTYQKPVVCWGNGIVMGGGLGLMFGADFRIATNTTMMAMPEITIGLYPDVGASWVLNKMPARIGLFMGLTGCRLNPADAKYLGLANRFIDHAFRENVLQSLQQADWQGNAYQITHNVIQHHADNSAGWLPYSKIREHRDIISQLMDHPFLKDVLADLEQVSTDDEWLQKASATALKGSPLSAAITFEQLRRSRHYSLKEAFDSELILSINCTIKGDVAEGVRALLVDKDQKPEWKFSSLAEISSETLESFFVLES